MYPPSVLVILAWTIPSMVLCAPILLRTMGNYEIIEHCLYDKAIWKDNPYHMCQYIVHQERNYLELKPDLYTISRILEIQPIYNKYWERKDKDQPILRQCYLTIGVFARCVGVVQTRLEMIGFTEQSKARLQTLWDEYMKMDEELVGHCFWFHHNDEYPRCHGISFDRNLGDPSARNQHLLNRWGAEQKALEAHIANAKSLNALILAQIDLCLYQNDWRYKETPTEEEALCFYVTGLRNVSADTSNSEKARIEAMKSAYDQQKLSDKVLDCYRHHRKDYNEYDGCRNVSWNLDARDGLSGFYVPEDPKLSELWYKIAQSYGEEHIWRKVTRVRQEQDEQATGFLGDLQAVIRNKKTK